MSYFGPVTLPAWIPAWIPDLPRLGSEQYATHTKRRHDSGCCESSGRIRLDCFAVLNGKVDVALETQTKVQEVIAQLGYTSNLAARSMRGGKMNLIGLIMPDIGFPFSAEVMKGVNHAIAESEFDLLLYTTGDVRKHETAAHQQRYVSLLNNSITDGVLIVATVAADFTSDAPLVSIDSAVVNPSYPSIHATNYKGALDAMNYLLGLGHTRIGFIGGRPELESTRSAARRAIAMRSSRLESPSMQALIEAGDYTAGPAAIALRRFMALDDPPTAIFAANDQSAIGVIRAANELGLHIPDDLSVVGFDNIPEAAYLDLTTVDQFVAEMSYIATNMLFSLIDGKTPEEWVVKMPTQLVIRGSCRRHASAVPSLETRWRSEASIKEANTAELELSLINQD